MLHLETIDSATLGLLTGLQEMPGLTETRLVGGTALALQFGHRISVDLDLFACNLQEDFISIISAIKKEKWHLEIRRQTTNILVAMINQVKVDIVNYPYPWLDPEVRSGKIRLASPKDIAAMKLAAITNRGTKKDFTDLYYLLKRYSLRQMLDFYSKKYDDASRFMVIKSLTYFDDAEEEIMPGLIDNSLSWRIIKEEIRREVKLVL